MVACSAAHQSRRSFPYMMLSRTPRLGDVIYIEVHTKHSVTVTLFAASGALHYSYYYELTAPWHDHSCLAIII